MSLPGSNFPTLDGDWFCAYEDRADYAVGLGILASSLAVNSPDARLLVASPLDPASIYPRIPSNCIFVPWSPEVGGWNVKPELLEHLLVAGARTATWIDADIFVHGDIGKLLPEDPALLVVCEETGILESKDVAEWARRLGRAPGRIFPRQINSSIVRVCMKHLPLLNSWKEVCHSPAYQEQQARPFDERDDPFKGDQDILTALLASVEYRDVCFHQLRGGRDIADLLCAQGFSIRERLDTIRQGIPPLLHAHGYPKPWMVSPGNWMALNPYVCAVRNLASRSDWDLHWARLPDWKSAFFYHLFLGNPALAGLPFLLRR